MSEQLRLMCITAHPDDESLGFGPALAQCAARGVEVSVVCATRGERGWAGAPEAYPGERALGEIREAELRAAAHVLGVAELHFLDYMDGELERADPREARARIAAHLRRFRPHVILTFDPFGAYGHPDHIALCQLTHAAVVAAAYSDPRGAFEDPPHLVQKLYYLAGSAEIMEAYQRISGPIKIEVNGEYRNAVLFPDWAVTTRVEAYEQWETVWRAIQCHQTQAHEYAAINQVSDEERRFLCAVRTFYRAFSFVNGSVEKDLFDGI